GTVYCRSDLRSPWVFSMDKKPIAGFHAAALGRGLLQVEGHDQVRNTNRQQNPRWSLKRRLDSPWRLKKLPRPATTVSYFLGRISSTPCRTAVTTESGDSLMSWCASTTTCRPRVDNRTRLACN